MEQCRSCNRNGYIRNGYPQRPNARNGMNGSNSGNGCGNNAVNGCRNNSVDNNSGRYKGLDSMPVGMTYVPFQQLDELYEPCRGLMEGTMFPELNLVFCGIRGKSR